MPKTFFTLLVLVGIAMGVAWFLFPPSSDGGLAIGATAPDFSGIASDGRVVHLNDLRGKVVVLDFWATWCPPCRGMIPHEREMAKKLQGKPFTFIGVSADESVEKLRKFIADERITWPNIFEGGHGALLRQYDVHYFPTIYVLDAAGVIRFKDVRGAELERAVEHLLEGLAGQAINAPTRK